MMKAGDFPGIFTSRIETIRRHISPQLLSSRSSNINVESLERLGIRVEPNVRRALAGGLPVVALESTIISHGMPYPQNLSTAKEVESVVKQYGATPATIAILDGVPCIGLTEKELEYLARCGPAAVKTSRRDIAQVIAIGGTGATTVSATMFFAAKAGIHVFVTGGIGGVHRLGESSKMWKDGTCLLGNRLKNLSVSEAGVLCIRDLSILIWTLSGSNAALDISSDLTELGRTPVLVVCAGVKSILDIPRTLEYLETQGVTVVGYGTEEFPAFFTSKSGCKASCRVDSPEQCAAIAEANLKLVLQSGIVVGVPIPEQHAAAAEPVEAAIQQALQEMREKNIQGNAVTPYLLKRVNELTGGGSLASNIELIKNNARVGAQISVALKEKLQQRQ